jgi:vanadium nitrogenase delta subunit
MMEEKIDDLYEYVQERCLWQFFSRTWDRQENIEGVLGKAEQLLTGGTPSRETPMDKLFYVDAAIVVKDFKERYSWIKDCSPAEIKQLLEGLKSRLVDTVITHSRNRELSHHLY